MTENYYSTNIQPIINGSLRECIEFLTLRGCLKQVSICDTCSLQEKRVHYNRCQDKLAWRCMNTLCTRYKEYSSIRKESFFEDMTIDLRKCVVLLWKWCISCTQVHARAEVAVSEKVIKKIFQKLRNCCYNYFVENPINLGGVGIKCQIDESLFRQNLKTTEVVQLNLNCGCLELLKCVVNFHKFI